MSARIAAALVLGAACAAIPRGERRSYEFPPSFDATQAVTVTLEGRTQELVASLRRRGDDFDLTLFDPVFSFPLLTSSSHGGVATEVRHVERVRPGDGKRLVELLVLVYETRYPLPVAGAAEASVGAVRSRLEQLPGDAPCQFPGVILVSPRFGAGPQVSVRTVEVLCGGP
ncbi:hypothetical protein [Anaeromyxobacter oryzisoli]|uniref:hypothetical protein n=1 Tax=Anaeromyxobacter oryzisoli TaxID=2925408 RepID=UPI001F5712FD|nr:hypothetical protein [Anaeromyxobacter sp. SG63]